MLGLVLSFATLFVSLALLVRTSFGRVPHAITFLPAPLVFYNAWMAAWFVFECLRQFAMTAMAPATALRLVAFVFLVASLLAVGFLYACVSVVHQLLGGTATRRVRRGAKHLLLLYSGLLVVGWSAYHFNADSTLFGRLRSALSLALFPLAFASWWWLLKGAAQLPDPAWRGRVQELARRYMWLFAVAGLAHLVRGRVEAIGPVIPLAVDMALFLAYSTITVFWVESV